MKQRAAYIDRRHYACRIRLELWERLKRECLRLNCSQGVFLEAALDKVLASSLVSEGDLYAYSSQQDIMYYKK